MKAALLNSAYRVLRTVNPSPYMFYLSMDDTEIAGASPETLISLQDGRLQTFPIAGTCPTGQYRRGRRSVSSRRCLEDEKELSEHNMLVDLGRNDRRPHQRIRQLSSCVRLPERSCASLMFHTSLPR